VDQLLSLLPQLVQPAQSVVVRDKAAA